MHEQLAKELEHLSAQRAVALETLHKIDGAIEMCKHLRDKAPAEPQPPSVMRDQVKDALALQELGRKMRAEDAKEKAQSNGK